MIDPEYIKTELENAPKEIRTARVDELAVFYGVSRQTIWRKANDAGFRVRAEKSTKGETSISERTLDVIAARVSISKRLTKQFTNSVKKAAKDLEKSGAPLPVGYQRVCTLLRERGQDKASLSIPDPHVKLISLHPNHVHQFDVTNCLQWHFKNHGGLKERDVERMFYNNKLVKEAKKIKLELLRFVIVDHCSGAFFFKYYYTTGERAEDGADFFYNAWQNKADLINSMLLNYKREDGDCSPDTVYSGAYQFQGVPKMLVSDKGSILRNKAMMNLMAGLNVRIELHQAGNPRAKGMVEGLMRIIGYDFESDLKIYNIQSLEDLNRFALDWCIARNLENSFRRSFSRAKLWLKIRQEELRLCPDKIIFTKLQHRPEEKRKCDGNGVVSFEGFSYKCPDVNAAYRKVVVKINAYDYPSVDIHFNGFVYSVEPLARDEYGRVETPDAVIYGQYKALKRTETQKAKTHLEQVAKEEWGVGFKGENDKRQAIPPATSVLPEVALKQDDKVIYLQKQGVEIATPDIHAPLTDENIKYISVYQDCERRETTFSPNKPSMQEGGTGERFTQRYVRLVPISQMIRMYVDEIGKLSVEENKRLKATFKDGVPAEFTITDIYNFLHDDEENKASEKLA